MLPTAPTAVAPVSSSCFREQRPITLQWPCAWPSMDSSPRAQRSGPHPSTPRSSPHQCCDVVITVKNTFINLAVGRSLSIDDVLPKRVAMSCPASTRRPLSSCGGERHETVVASAFDKPETALVNEAISPTNSATKAEEATADLDNHACSSATSALLKMVEDTSPITSACKAEDAPSNLDAASSAEMKSERLILAPLRLPISQRDDQEPLSLASSSTVAEQVEADYGSAATMAMIPSLRKQGLLLGDRLVQMPPLPEQQRQQPKLGSRELPTLGSAGHHIGGCRPCAFMHSSGCAKGINCNHCHLCKPGEKKRRRKQRKLAFACHVAAQLKTVHHQQQPAAGAAAATRMGHATCQSMMSPPVVSGVAVLPSKGNWMTSPSACSPGGISSTGSNAWLVESWTTSQFANGGIWPTAASPTASDAVLGTRPVAASPSASNAIGGWKNPQLRMAAVFSIF